MEALIFLHTKKVPNTSEMELESESTIPKLSFIYATAIRQLLITPISQSKELKPRALRHLLDQGHKRVSEVPEFELTDPKAVSALPTAPHCFHLQHVSIERPTSLSFRTLDCPP